MVITKSWIGLWAEFEFGALLPLLIANTTTGTAQKFHNK